MARTAVHIWVLALVQRVRGHGFDRRAPFDRAGFEDEAVTVQSAEHHVHGERLGGEGATFEYLAHMDRKTEITALPNRVGGDRGIVAGPAGDDHIRSLVERMAERLVAHLRDERDGLVNILFGKIVACLEVLYLASADGRLGALARDIGVDPGELKLDPALARDLAHDVEGPVYVRLAARSTGAPDDHRDLGAAPGLDELGQLLLHAESGDQRIAGTKIMGPRICGARIDRNHIRAERHASLQRFPAEPVAQRSCRSENSDRFLQDSSPLDILPAERLKPRAASPCRGAS